MFFDEIDGLCSTRNASASDSGVSGRVLSQFLAEMDGIEELTGVFVLAATNRPDMVDPALRRALVALSKRSKLSCPILSSRRQILSVHLKNRPLAEEIDLEALALSTDGLSGADLAAVCSQAARTSIRRAVETAQHQLPQAGDVLIRKSDIVQALDQVRQNRRLNDDLG